SSLLGFSPASYFELHVSETVAATPNHKQLGWGPPRKSTCTLDRNCHHVWRLQHGSHTSNPVKVLDMFQQHLSALYSSQDLFSTAQTDRFFTGLDLPQLTEAQVSSFEEPITEEEVGLAIAMLSRGKRPVKSARPNLVDLCVVASNSSPSTIDNPDTYLSLLYRDLPQWHSLFWKASIAESSFSHQDLPQSLIIPVKSCFYEQFPINVLAFLYAIRHINQNPEILPNITLGSQVLDSCLHPSLAVRNVLSILSGPQKTVPNYSCSGERQLVGFIGDQYSVTTIPMAQILGILGYTQISYGATDYSLTNRLLYPHVFRMVQNDHVHYMAVIRLLKYFGWTWVGILASEDDAGDKDKEIITKYMKNNGICVEFTLSLGPYIYKDPVHEQPAVKHGISVMEASSAKVPVSRCSDPCVPGTRKKFGSSVHECCYECVPCPEGEISNIPDSENCMKCSDEEWPNEKKDRCVPKLVEFLSYTDDTIVAVFSAVSSLCCLLTGVILGMFILYQDTPVVEANNRNLSYLLLVSIMLSFLCVFLFLGHPVDVTCMLRVTAFGVIFSVAVSSLLAKSIMVFIAFKATNPGSSWRKWMGITLPNSIMSVLSMVQVIICVTWLAIYPPFQDRDTHSYQGKIIIQCNEGSVIGFYSVLGYMGLLAAVSFIIAFLARTLPDSFNEAKYITFSMLVFCSVWIAMIPAYLSTRGKYMVAVEIFAIMASSAGLLVCIFFPKCYIILFRPDLNTKAGLLANRR
ncbi:PREDICTED: vomeronasal type-2 receptor 26-like, partial [Nanorana parkeri]|uniref:vomeronasal type-2 receptor 26-like n=1 Tax=Nanorana parkeri TaxID=125878 RepID=UPI000854CC5E